MFKRQLAILPFDLPPLSDKAAALLAGSPIPMLANKAAAAGHAGGMSSSHISAAGLHNSNGPNAIDRDFGQACAEDRRSAQELGTNGQQLTSTSMSRANRTERGAAIWLLASDCYLSRPYAVLMGALSLAFR